MQSIIEWPQRLFKTGNCIFYYFPLNLCLVSCSYNAAFEWKDAETQYPLIYTN